MTKLLPIRFSVIAKWPKAILFETYHFGKLFSLIWNAAINMFESYFKNLPCTSQESHEETQQKNKHVDLEGFDFLIKNVWAEIRNPKYPSNHSPPKSQNRTWFPAPFATIRAKPSSSGSCCPPGMVCNVDERPLGDETTAGVGTTFQLMVVFFIAPILSESPITTKRPPNYSMKTLSRVASKLRYAI